MNDRNAQNEDLGSRAGEHVASWLGAYHDGEVSAAQRERIEVHLAVCPGCAGELEALRRLSALLQASPLPPPAQSDAEFARAVVSRATRPAPPLWRRGLKAAWRFAPLSLFASWAFFQAVRWVSGAVLIGMRLLPGGQALLPSTAADDSFLLDLLRMRLLESQAGRAFESLGWPGPLDQLALLDLAAAAVLAVLFLSWLASWWAYQRAHAADQTVDP
jgi:hypothetical protein